MAAVQQDTGQQKTGEHEEEIHTGGSEGGIRLNGSSETVALDSVEVVGRYNHGRGDAAQAIQGGNPGGRDWLCASQAYILSVAL